MGFAWQHIFLLTESGLRCQSSTESTLRYSRKELESSAETRTKSSEAILACFSYAGCSTLLTLANKVIFSENKLNYPWMLLGVQSAVVTLLLLIYYAADTSQPLLKRDLLRQMILPCTFFTSFIFTNARALRYISLPVLTVIKSLAPIAVALLERALFMEPISFSTYGAMTLILFGNAITVVHDLQFQPIGYIWAFLNVLMNVAYVVSLRYCLSNSYSSGQKTLHSNILACSFIFPMAVLGSETPGFFAEFGRASFRFRGLFLLSCVLAAGIGASVFWVIRTTSGSTLSFIGATNKVLVVILGAALFDAKISLAGWAGVALGTLAGFWFAAAKANGGKGRKAEGKPKEESQELEVGRRKDMKVDLRTEGLKISDRLCSE